MIHYAQIDASGRVLRTGSVEDMTFAVLKAALPGATLVQLDLPVTQAHTVYWDGEAIRDMPPAPTVDHRFDYDTKAWALDVAAAWARVRTQRDELLRQSDWVRIKAIDTGVELDSAWIDYRQALRDITLQADPQAIVWPTSPP